MSNEFNKSEADLVYERYTKLGSQSPEGDFPRDDLLPNDPTQVNHTPIGSASLDFNKGIEDGSDPVLVGDPYLAADIGLNILDPTPDRTGYMSTSHTSERNELLESDAILAAETAGLTGSVIDYTEDEKQLEDEDDDLPLEDIPDADEIEPGSAIDPVSPPVDVMPGTDIINGSQGE